MTTSPKAPTEPPTSRAGPAATPAGAPVRAARGRPPLWRPGGDRRRRPRRSRAGEVLGARRALGLRQVHPARARRGPREPAAARSPWRAASAARAACRAAPTCPSATCCFPGCSAIDNAALGAAQPRRSKRARARAGPRRCSSASGLPASADAAGRALGRDAPAGRVPAHAARRQAGAAARRALRRARRDHPRRDAGVACRGARRPSRAPFCSSPTTSRRRSTSATACGAVGRARPRRSPSVQLAGAARRATARGGHLARVLRRCASARCEPCREAGVDEEWLPPAVARGVAVGALGARGALGPVADASRSSRS